MQRQQRGLEYSGTRVSTYAITYPGTGDGNEGREEAMVLVWQSKQLRLLSPQPSQALRNHSPDGFEWGYAGSGPSQLALAILLDFTGDKELTLNHY